MGKTMLERVTISATSTCATQLCVTVLYHRLGYGFFLATELWVFGGGWYSCRMVAHVAYLSEY